LKRGDVVLGVAPGDVGKPRPAVVVQSNTYNDSHASIVVCLLTSHIIDAPLFRITIEPKVSNGLKKQSQIMIDKISALSRDRFGATIGALEAEEMVRVDRALANWIGLGG
jgi:mRNA interferase MazF